jgi:hypothetical protein
MRPQRVEAICRLRAAPSQYCPVGSIAEVGECIAPGVQKIVEIGPIAGLTGEAEGRLHPKSSNMILT